MTTIAERLALLCTPVAAGEPVALDVVAATIAELAPDPPSADQIVARLDDLAAGVTGRTAESVTGHVFGPLGFVGDTETYYRPSNSYIHHVLDRRRGIPLTLAIVAAEIGRRVGVGLDVIGMPGHVLIGTGTANGGGSDGGGADRRWFDPFDGGRALSRDDCRRVFARFSQADLFDDAMLAPIDARQITSRMLANLKAAEQRAGETGRLVDVATVAAGLPWSAAGERLDLARALMQVGRDEQAAVILEDLAATHPDRRRQLLAMVTHLRARSN